jgi:N-acetylneuraminic acid mutarotase
MKQIFTLAALAASLALSAAPIESANAAGSGTWTLTGSLSKGRESQTATLLPNGNVLVAGGETSTSVTASSEVYVPGTATWSAAGNMAVARAAQQAVLLPSGKVLVAGGCIAICASGNTATAELYNPSTRTWSKTGSMATARVYFGMTLLSNGTVLAVGGCTGQNANGCSGVTSSAEIYNPSTGTWSATSPMHAGRGAFTTTVLKTGQVLVAGGINAANNPINSVEKYNPVSGQWILTGQLKVARDEHTATLLPNGNVLVAGGENPNSVSTTKAELYNPATKTWTLTGSMSRDRLEHTAVLLPNGTVLVSGGNKVTANTTTVLSTAEIYNPGTGAWSTTGSMNAARVGHSSTLLGSGIVLNAGGANTAGNEQSSAEAYQP